MHQAATTTVFETESMEEACADLVRAHEFVQCLPGAAARRLQHDIERDSWTIFHAPTAIEALGEGFFIYVPPPELSALLARARKLGVIR